MSRGQYKLNNGTASNNEFEQIKKELYDQGILTKEEFTAKKQELLKKIQ